CPPPPAVLLSKALPLRAIIQTVPVVSPAIPPFQAGMCAQGKLRVEPFMSITRSRAMDLRPVARAAQRLFTANQILFVVALAFGIVLGADLVARETDGYVRTAANDAVRVFLLGGLFVYALLFALMDYTRRYWIGVALAAALVITALAVGGTGAVIELSR